MAMTNARAIGWYVNEWLEASGMTQNDLAQMTGWSKQKISAICTGRNGYNRRTIETVSTALGIHPAELFLPPHRALLIRQILLDRQ
jgi:transcriptional regulator with XRE-family HTH domain